MKANEAPEKIYVQPNAHDGWFETNNLTKSLTEYIRKDTFIEKIANFLNYELDDVISVSIPGKLIPELTTRQDFIEHFKKFMEGE